MELHWPHYQEILFCVCRITLICDDHDVETRLLCHYVKFIYIIIKSSNHVRIICLRMAINDSRSHISNTMSLLCRKFRRSDIVRASTRKLVNNTSMMCDDAALLYRINVICDIVNFRTTQWYVVDLYIVHSLIDFWKVFIM